MLEWLETTLKRLNVTDTMDPPQGFTRLGYTQEEWAAMDVFQQVAEELGLNVRQDAAGNRIARWETEQEDYPSVSGLTAIPGASSRPAVALGSHLDTVVSGGGYDGVAGLLCALGAVKWLKRQGFTPLYPVEIICFAAEESARFGVSTIGSKAMAGLLSVEELAGVKDQHGITLREAVEQMGLSWSDITKAERSQQEIKRFVELHIEQGTRIEKSGAQFGVATAIACPIRLKIEVEGQMGHTGTTPMDERRDALVAVAPLISFVAERAEQLSASSPCPVVATASTLQVKPNVMNVIPGWVELGIDIRSVDDKLKIQLAQSIKEKCAELEQCYHVKIKIDTLVHNPSVTLDRSVADDLLQTGERLGYKGLLMESGAGHDVMNMAHKWPSGLLFIPCREGLSHHPREYAALDDLLMGTHILAAYLQGEAGE
ncbi:M20 family metallo-hydrolase [Caldalkalibacillus thermarum TA2.A1]|nr:M20 family metallo-hydrolase [Caldalkalibacillus thermarum]QZT35243.1 M20 family metallo-hydrolase [Caldalkalibacillus thermarum TA2.A1]